MMRGGDTMFTHKVPDEIRKQPISYFSDRSPECYQWLLDNGFKTVEDVIARQDELPKEPPHNFNGEVKMKIMFGK